MPKGIKGFQKGHVDFSTEDGLRAIGEKTKERWKSGGMNGFKKGAVPWNFGKKLSEEHKKKLSIAKIGRPGNNKGKHWNIGEDKKKNFIRLGERNPAWKGGVTKIPGYKSHWNAEYRARKRIACGCHELCEWENLKAQYNWTCPCCGKSEPEIKLTEDHIIPLSNGGSNNIENIQPLCRSCNCKKHTKIIKY